MQVLFISYDGMLEPLGQSQVLPYLRGLALRGASITLLSFEKAHDRMIPGRVQSLQAELSGRGIRWVPLRYHKHPTLLATAFDVLVGTVCAWRIIRARRVQVVHARSDVPALMAWLLTRVLRIRFLFDMRGFWADERVDAGRWSSKSLGYRVATSFERRFLAAADDIVTLTERARHTLERWPGMAGRRISVIPTCVDLERFVVPPRRWPPDAAPVFIYIGSGGTWYLLEEMFTFVRAALQRFPQARVLVLTRQHNEAVAALARTGLAPQTVTITSVDASAVPIWLAQAHAGLAFYKPGFARRGTCPTKIGEYLATGLPVVVNEAVGDVEEFVGAGGVGAVLPGFSSDAYAQALDRLEQLWADPMLAARCRQLAERCFDLQAGVETYYALYERIMGLRGPAEKAYVTPQATETGESS